MKHGTKYPWMKEIQVCSIKGPCPLPRGDNYKNVNKKWDGVIKNLLKNHWASYNQTWHKSFFEGDDSSLLK
jgi:hypothetical protein